MEPLHQDPTLYEEIREWCSMPPKLIGKRIFLTVSDPECERKLNEEMTNMDSSSMGIIGGDYKSFKKKYKTYLSVKDIGDKEAQEAARIKIEDELDNFLIKYGQYALTTLANHMEQSDKVVSLKKLADNDRLPDFVTQMASCLGTHFIRSGSKLGTKYKPELDRLKRVSADAERKEKGIQKTAEQIQKDAEADKEYKKAVAEYAVKRKEKLRKLEEARLEKLRAKEEKRKAAEAKEKERLRKEEEKRKAAEAKEKERLRKEAEKKKKAEEKQRLADEKKRKADVEKQKKEAAKKKKKE